MDATWDGLIMLTRYWTNKVGLAGVLVLYGASVLLLDLLGASEFAAMAVPLALVPLACLIPGSRRLFSGMMLPGILICATVALVYGSFSWTDAQSASLVYAAYLLLAASWGYAIYRAFSTPT